MAYGEAGGAAFARQASADASSAKLSAKVAIERAQLKGKKAYRNAHWDVIDAVEADGKFLDKAKEGALPAELRGKTLAEKKEIIGKNAAKRAEIRATIAKLESERSAFLEDERKKQPEAAPSLETELMKSTKKVAAKKGYKF
jgi:hypothetical protein